MMSDTTVVFSTYHPSPDFVGTVEALLPRFSVVIVDDGTPEESPTLDAAAQLGATVIRQPENRGIAAALNLGLRTAFDAGASFVVTFDQDSAPEDATIDVLRTTFDEVPDATATVAAIVPAQFAAVTQSRATGDYPNARRVIQSGMLISVGAYRRLGPFDEALFIDLVDTEFELRALARGYRILAAPTRIDHELGRTLPLKPFAPLPFTVTTMASTPFRYYYRVRNRLALTRRYFRLLPWRIMRDLAVDGAYFALIALSARPRRRMVGVMWAGARDGLHRRGGKMPTATAAQASEISWASSR